jgi:probable HAF family extracellular repeat protein
MVEIKIAAAFLALIGLPLTAARHGVVYNGSSWTDLGTLSGDVYSRALATNGTTIVGHTASPRLAFTYNGSMSALADLQCSFSEAKAINSSTTSVGYSAFSPPSCPTWHAVFWNGGSITDIDPLSSTSGWSVAHGINGSAVIVGESVFSTNGPVHAFKYTSSMTDLGTLGGRESVAYSINTASTVAGTSQTASDGWHLFKYTGSTMADLGKPPLSACSYGDFPVSIDDSSNIAGTSCPQAWYYDSSFHTIPLLSGDTASQAYSISNGVVVGWGYPSRHPWSFTISGAVLVDLGTAKTGGGSWDWVNAMAISSSGQIVGFAGLNSDI